MLSNNQTESLVEAVTQLRYFLSTAHMNWSSTQQLKRFQMPNGETISCVFWKNTFFITGTDIVRSLVFRFQAYGRPVKNMKKFEEGIFSDLRNLKPGVDAILEEPRSEFLEMLYKNNCIRTQKKQKVFYWFSVPHDRLFLDALERDHKRESEGKEPSTVALQNAPLVEAMTMNPQTKIPSSLKQYSQQYSQPGSYANTNIPSQISSTTAMNQNNNSYYIHSNRPQVQPINTSMNYSQNKSINMNYPMVQTQQPSPMVQNPMVQNTPVMNNSQMVQIVTQPMVNQQQIYSPSTWMNTPQSMYTPMSATPLNASPVYNNNSYVITSTPMNNGQPQQPQMMSQGQPQQQMMMPQENMNQQPQQPQPQQQIVMASNGQQQVVITQAGMTQGQQVMMSPVSMNPNPQQVMMSPTGMNQNQQPQQQQPQQIMLSPSGQQQPMMMPNQQPMMPQETMNQNQPQQMMNNGQMISQVQPQYINQMPPPQQQQPQQQQITTVQPNYTMNSQDGLVQSEMKSNNKMYGDFTNGATTTAPGLIQTSFMYAPTTNSAGTLCSPSSSTTTSPVMDGHGEQIVFSSEIDAKNEYAYSCDIKGCGRKFKRMELLRRHQRCHQNDTSYGKEMLNHRASTQNIHGMVNSPSSQNALVNTPTYQHPNVTNIQTTPPTSSPMGNNMMTHMPSPPTTDVAYNNVLMKTECSLYTPVSPNFNNVSQVANTNTNLQNDNNSNMCQMPSPPLQYNSNYNPSINYQNQAVYTTNSTQIY